METLRKHSDILNTCHPDEAQTKAGCEARIKDCGGNSKATESFIKIDRIEKDISEIKTEQKKKAESDVSAQISLGATISRIETQLQALLQTRDYHGKQ